MPKTGTDAQLKNLVAKLDRSTVAATLRELDFKLAFDTGLQVKAFQAIQFERRKWERSQPSEGCFTYTATGAFADLAIIDPDGTRQELEFDKGDQVLVCGRVVHLPLVV